jgi:hypothetical protein
VPPVAEERVAVRRGQAGAGEARRAAHRRVHQPDLGVGEVDGAARVEAVVQEEVGGDAQVARP